MSWDLDSLTPTINAASDVCLVFINAMATEGWDRPGLHDDSSDSLILHVAARCSNTIVVIHAAGIRLVDQWVEHPNVTAVVLAHLPGQDSGPALERLLFGDANFSGKLPYTVAKNESDYTPFKPCGLLNSTDTDPQCDYTEGVYVDYRAFDKHNITPRYEFGYGLSYTRFHYSTLEITPRNLTADIVSAHDDMWEPILDVHAVVANVGSVPGSEVAQLYLGIPDSPRWQLRGFDKTPLQPGYWARVTFELTRRDLSVWDVVRQAWVLQDGDYRVHVGASSRDVRLKGMFRLQSAMMVAGDEQEETSAYGQQKEL